MMAVSVVYVPFSLCLGAILVYGVGRLVARRNALLAGLTAGVFGWALFLSLQMAHLIQAQGPVGWSPQTQGPPVLLAEPGALFVLIVALGLALLVALYSGRYLSLDQRYEHYYPLLLFLLAGLAGMVMAVDLFTLYLLTMLTSASTYVLVAFRRRTETAIEAGFKYVIMGGMGSILVLAGLGLVYGESGSLALPLTGGLDAWQGRLGGALILFGYLVKAAIVPAHTWLPDAHGRAPSSISAILSGILIEAYLYTLIKVCLGIGLRPATLGWLLVGLAALNMGLGNLMALRQTYGKRLLAYSSIAQLGYIMLAMGLGLTYGRVDLLGAGFFLILSHALLKSMAFLCKGAYHFYHDATLLRELDGLAYSMPGLSACFVLALAGLAGLPPLSGFWGKLYFLMGAAPLGGLLPALAVIILLANSLLALGYYLPLIGRLLRRVEGHPAQRVSRWMEWPVFALGALAVALAFWPGPALSLAERAARFLFAWGRL